jgi:hypothetical protein
MFFFRIFCNFLVGLHVVCTKTWYAFDMFPSRGLGRPSGELEKAPRLGLLLAREPARRGNEPSHKHKSAL